MPNYQEILGRKNKLFANDISKFNQEITDKVEKGSFLVIGGGGTIGQAIVKELFKRRAKKLHVVDISENYLVESVRDLRSSLGYRVKDFDTFALDCGADYFDGFMKRHNYDYVLNLSAMKHVRSENDPISMYRMIQTNIFNSISTYNSACAIGAKKYFCVSSDKAANPANFMGATKRAMELSLMRETCGIAVSGARFANVAFSHGSLLEGFNFRLEKQQPLSAPKDILRFFITPEESGIICLFSAILGNNNEIYFPYSDKEIRLTSFIDISKKFLNLRGKSPIFCESEDEARELITSVDLEKFWPVNIFNTDTAGEKPFEEFYTNNESLNYDKYSELASIDFVSSYTDSQIDNFILGINSIDLFAPNSRKRLIEVMKTFVPTFKHVESDKFLNGRM